MRQLPVRHQRQGLDLSKHLSWRIGIPKDLLHRRSVTRPPHPRRTAPVQGVESSGAAAWIYAAGRAWSRWHSYPLPRMRALVLSEASSSGAGDQVLIAGPG